jgi:hypothetical protein
LRLPVGLASAPGGSPPRLGDHPLAWAAIPPARCQRRAGVAEHQFRALRRSATAVWGGGGKAPMGFGDRPRFRRGCERGSGNRGLSRNLRICNGCAWGSRRSSTVVRGGWRYTPNGECQFPEPVGVYRPAPGTPAAAASCGYGAARRPPPAARRPPTAASAPPRAPESTRATLARVEGVDYVERHLHHRHHHQLRNAFHRLQRERR